MIKKIAVTAVLAAVSPALASDNFEIFGPGTQTCGQYLASSEHDQLLAEYWISGFFSGVSLAEPTQNQTGMHDATGGKGLTSVLKIIKAICQGELYRSKADRTNAGQGARAGHGPEIILQCAFALQNCVQ